MNVRLENVRMRMLLGGAEKMSPISSVMMAILSQNLWFMVGL